jgi:hypothetical protein
MSLTATAIKLVRFGSFPSMLVYYENDEWKWFIPSAEDLPKKLWPSKQPDKGTLTARLISGGTDEEGPEDVRADNWFDVYNSDRICEICFRNGPNSVITILWWGTRRR